MPENRSYLPRLIATSVVRGSEQGDSHGGIFTVDFDKQEAFQHVDWNTSEIDFSGRGWDRGLRGIEFHDDEIYIAASDELFIYNQDFQIRRSFRNPYLKHCHEICKKDKLLFLTSTGYDSILVFDLSAEDFIRGLYIEQQYPGWQIQQFSPHSTEGPGLINKLHLNMVSVQDTGIYFSGLHTGALLHLGKNFEISEICNLPAGNHNARPFRDGVLFNDTTADCVRYVGRNGGDRVFRIKRYPEQEIRYAGIDDSKIARQEFWPGSVPLVGQVYCGWILAFHNQRIRSLLKQNSCQRQPVHGYQECDPRAGNLAVRLTRILHQFASHRRKVLCCQSVTNRLHFHRRYKLRWMRSLRPSLGATLRAAVAVQIVCPDDLSSHPLVQYAG